MSATGWSRKFAEPIKAGKSVLTTLHDAGEYIAVLPPREAEGKHWQTAKRCLIDAADRGGILTRAEIAMRRALNAGK